MTAPLHIDVSDVNRWRRQAADALSPSRAAAVADKLGPLARWWLRPRVLETARRDPASAPMHSRWVEPQASELNAEPGCCSTIFAIDENPRGCLLRDALVWPLRWRRTPDHDPGLPQPLRVEADRVLAALGVLADGDSDWSLHLDVPRCDPGTFDLSGLAEDIETAGSAWVSLATGLWIARAAGRPRPAVWASGAWRESGGIDWKLGGVEQKLALAADLGVQTLFVPAPIVDRFAGAQARDAGVDLQPLTCGDADPLRSLKPLRVQVQIPPDRDDGQRERAEWYNLLTSRSARSDFYREACLEEIADHLRSDLTEHLQGRRVGVLVTGYSHGIPFDLALRAMDPDRCLVLAVDADGEREASQIVASLPPALAKRCRVARTPVEPGPVCAAVRSFFNEADRSELTHVAFDLTPGPTAMKMILALDAAQVLEAGAAAFCVTSDTDPHHNRPVLFTERWQWRWIRRWAQ